MEKDNRGELEFAEAAGESAVLELQARWKAQGALAASKVPEKQWPKHLKPRKVRRNKTFEWGLCFFNAILLSVGVQFNYYALDLTRSAFEWPKLSVALDEGSDGRAAIHALHSPHFKFNVEGKYDVNHGVHNNYKAAVKGIGEWSFLLLCIVIWNLPHMPYDEDRFFHTIKEGVEQWLTVATEDDSTLQEAIPGILFDKDKQELAAEEGTAGKILEELREEHLWGVKEDKVNLCRFLSTVHRAQQAIPQWHLRLFQITVTRMCQGKITNDRMHQIMREKKAKFKEKDASATASSSSSSNKQPVKRGNEEISKLRSVCENSVDIAWYILSDMFNLFKLRIMARMGKPTLAFHTEQNNATRDVGGAAEWQINLASGGLFALVSSTLKMLQSPEDLRYMGMHTRTRTFPGNVELHEDHPFIVEQNELASMAGRFAVELCKAHLVRFVDFYRSLRHRVIMMAHKDSVVRAAAARKIKRDYNNWQMLALSEEKDCRKMVLRSVFNTVPGLQIVKMLEEDGWVCTTRIHEWCVEEVRGIVTTQLIEDFFNRERNEERKGRTHRMAEDRYWTALIDAMVTSAVHRYAPVDYKSHPVPRRPDIPKSHYHALVKECAVPEWSTVRSSSSKISWHSPDAAHVSQRASDMVLCDHLRHGDKWCEVEFRWLSCLYDGVPLLVRSRQERSPYDEPEMWILVLGSVGSSAAIGVMVEEDSSSPKLAPRDDEDDEERTAFKLCYRPSGNVYIKWVLTTSMDQYDARAFVFESPAARMVQLDQDHFERITVIAGEVESLYVACARVAFGKLNTLQLIKLGQLEGAEVAPGMRLFAVLMALLKHALPELSEEEHVKIIQRYRLRAIKGSDVNAILEMDGAAAVLETTDKKDADDARQATKVERAAYKELKAEIKAKLNALKCKPKNKAGTKMFIPVGELSQPGMKKLIPPKSAVWRNNFEGAWAGHLRPNNRVSFPFKHYNGSSREAGVALLRALWGQHLERNPTDVCPVEGLFGEDVTAAAEAVVKAAKKK